MPKRFDKHMDHAQVLLELASDSLDRAQSAAETRECREDLARVRAHTDRAKGLAQNACDNYRRWRKQ